MNGSTRTIRVAQFGPFKVLSLLPQTLSLRGPSPSSRPDGPYHPRSRLLAKSPRGRRSAPLGIAWCCAKCEVENFIMQDRFVLCKNLSPGLAYLGMANPTQLPYIFDATLFPDRIDRVPSRDTSRIGQYNPNRYYRISGVPQH